MWSSAAGGQGVNMGTALTPNRVLVNHPVCPQGQEASSCVRHMCVEGKSTKRCSANSKNMFTVSRCLMLWFICCVADFDSVNVVH